MAIKAYLLHFSYKLLYFAEVINICKMEQDNICAPLIVSLGYPKKLLTSFRLDFMMALKCSWPIKNKLLPVQNCTVVVCRYFQGWSSDTKAFSFRFMPAQTNNRFPVHDYPKVITLLFGFPTPSTTEGGHNSNVTCNTRGKEISNRASRNSFQGLIYASSSITESHL